MLYSAAKDRLHTEGYYEQRFSPTQKTIIEKIRSVVKKELS